MKVWRYYIKPSENITNDQYELYAITSNKKFARKFEKLRNMEKFVKITSNMSKEKYIEFANKNRRASLTMESFKAKAKNNTDILSHKCVDILCTEYEYLTIQELIENEYISEINDSDWWKGYSPIIHYNAYKEKIKNALVTIEYASFYRTCYNEQLMHSYDNEEFPGLSIWVDEVSLFIQMFGETFL